MKKEQYLRLEQFMQQCMADSAHDREHVYRVLYLALSLAKREEAVNLDVLTAACLLHDIGRQAQFADPTVCHAQAGAEMAQKFLLEQGFGEAFAGHVYDCILTHRFRKSNPPETMEAKLLFDADKLDVTGAMGIARSLLYQGKLGTPLYTLTEDGQVSDGTGDTEDSFFREYKFKLETIYDGFYTAGGRELAQQRRQAAQNFYENLLAEVLQDYTLGNSVWKQLLEEA